MIFLLVLAACVRDNISTEGLKPEVSKNYVYYKIGGTTAQELRGQMDKFDTSHKFRGHHDAYTQWDANWSYPYSEIDSSCTTGPVKVGVTITFTFPKWNIPEHASPELVDRWNAYLDALQTHEGGHTEIAIDAGREIFRALTALPAYPSCRELEQAADDTGQRILEQFRQQEIEYDRRTNHGETQNARFP